MISEQEIEPPPAILEINGKEQISGIGSYCWKGILKGLCADMIGLPTAQEPLIAGSPYSAHLTLPVQEPLYELQLNIFQGKDEDELNFSGGGWRWWNEKGSASYGFLVEVRENDTGAVNTTPRFPVNQTPPSPATTTPTITTIQPDIGTIGTRVIITGAGFTAMDNNIAFRLAPGDTPVGGNPLLAGFQVQNHGMPRPGLEPGTSASSAQRSPRLSYLGT